MSDDLRLDRREIGGFGSAGSSRSLRRTATAVTTGASTALVAEMVIARQSLPARLDEPTNDDIMAGIRDQQCPWCNDARTFQSLGGHLGRAHGISLADLRDRLLLPKKYAFASIGLRETQAARGRRAWTEGDLAERLKTATGRPHRLGAYGLAVQKEKAQRSKITQYGPRGRKGRICVVCGTDFVSGKKSSRRTCSPECEAQWRSRQTKGVPHVYQHSPILGARIYRDCVWCGRNFWSRGRLTCSIECRKANGSAKAAARTDHMKLVQAAARAKMASRPIIPCSAEDCDRPSHCKGLCTMHYGRLKASRKRALG